MLISYEYCFWCTVRSCHDPPNINNGRIDRYLNVAQYTCAIGYHLEGNESRKCQDDFTWSGRKPTCESIIVPEILSSGTSKKAYV